MANAIVLETLSLKELGALGSSVRLKYWQHLRKSDLLERLAALNRVFTQEDLDAAIVALTRKQAARAARAKVSQDVPASNLQNVANDEASDSAQRTALNGDNQAPSDSSYDLSDVRNVKGQTSKSASSTTASSTTALELKKDVADSLISADSNKLSDLNVRSKTKKSTRRSESLKTSDSASADVAQENVLTRQEASAYKSDESKEPNTRLDAEKALRIADQVVPALAERLAKRIVACLAKEFASEDSSNVQDVPVAESSNDKNLESYSADVVSKLVDEIVSPPVAKSSENEVLGDLGKPEDVQIEKDSAKNVPQDEDRSQANKQKEKSDDEEEGDDVLIDTIVPETSVLQRSFARPADGTSLLKDRLRLKKFIGSPRDKVDRLVLMVCDPYWIRACWEVTEQLVERVRSAMARHWHTADPILRLYQIDPATSRREFVKDVEISGGVSNWYVPVENPPSTFAVELGYKSRDGQFFTLLSSNAVQTPKQFVRDSDGRPCTEAFNSPFGFQTSSHDRWTQKSRHTRSERRSSFDETPVKAFLPSASAVGTSLSKNDGYLAPSTFLFQVDAEVLFTGRVSNGATVKVREESVCQAPDGSFSIRFSLPERRHVFPIVATSLDANETQTIVVAIERNTKTLDPVYKEDDE